MKIFLKQGQSITYDPQNWAGPPGPQCYNFSPGGAPGHFFTASLARKPFSLHNLSTDFDGAKKNLPNLRTRQPAIAESTAAGLSKTESVASAFLRNFQYMGYGVRSAAEAMPEKKSGYLPADGQFKHEKPEFRPCRGPHLRAAGEAHRLCQLRLRRGTRRKEAADRLRQGQSQSRED